jgi:phospholipid transport system substrate-binding protein
MIGANEPHSGEPMDATRAILDKASAIVASGKDHNAKLDDLKRLLTDFLDTDRMGRAALAKRWADFDRTQQKEFLGLFRELFQRTYVEKLLLFEQPKFGYTGQHRTNSDALVETKIITPKDEFNVSYKLVLERGRWRAVDVIVEDLSLITNFEHQLDRLLSQSSPSDVLDRMRKKYGE